MKFVSFWDSSGRWFGVPGGSNGLGSTCPLDSRTESVLVDLFPRVREGSLWIRSFLWLESTLREVSRPWLQPFEPTKEGSSLSLISMLVTDPGEETPVLKPLGMLRPLISILFIPIFPANVPQIKIRKPRPHTTHLLTNFVTQDPLYTIHKFEHKDGKDIKTYSLHNTQNTNTNTTTTMCL